MFNYNDIRNQNWFERLQRNIRGETSRNVLGSGSQPDDPYWKAVEAEKLGDLSSAREDAFRNARIGNMNRMASSMFNQRLKEKARQESISAALKQQWQPDVQFTGNFGTPQMPQMGEFAGLSSDMLTSPGQSPDAYNAPMGGGSKPQISGNFGGMVNPNAANYNPQQFFNKNLQTTKKKLKKTMYGLSGY